MAGIILTLGDDSNSDFNEIKLNYEGLKGLKNSYKFQTETCQLFKYKRKYEKTDHNYFESSDFSICVVGSVIYGGHGFEASLCEIEKNLKKGVSISEIAKDIDGHYCLIIVDKKKNELFIMTDIGGFINAYILQKNDCIYISTSMLALSQTFEVTPDKESILMFLRAGNFFDDTTYFKEISALKAASIYTYCFESNALKRKEYWSVPKQVDTRISFQQAANSISKALDNIISFIPNTKAIYDFTGGYDSRFVLSFVYKNETKKDHITTFFFGPPGSREEKIIKDNCLNLGMNYSNYVIEEDWPQKYFKYILEANNLNDGLNNSCNDGTVLWVQKQKGQKYDFAVNGLFGELYRQRRWITEFGRRGQKRHPNLERLIKYREMTESFDDSMFLSEYQSVVRDTSQRIIQIYNKTNEVFDHRAPNTLQLDYIYFAQKARRWGGRSVTTANQLIRTVCPLWFKKPLEISFALPPQYKKKCKLMRSIVEENSYSFAKQKMITMAPFFQINFKNIFHFLPAVFFFIQIAIRKIFQVFLKKNIWEGLTTPDYDNVSWFRTALMNKQFRKLIDFDNMTSSFLYDKCELEDFINKSLSEGFSFYNQLGRMITVELTLKNSKFKK